MIVPKQVIIEVTSACNLSCKYCPHLTDDNPHAHMPFEDFLSIVHRAPQQSVIIPWMNGEPLLHPEYHIMIKHLSARNRKNYITTNGMIWDEKVFQKITDKDSSTYQIIFSLDGLPHKLSKSIEIARPGSDRQTILENIDRFLQLKLDKQSNIDVGIKICRRGQDYQETEAYIQYWLLREGVDYVCVGDALIEHNEQSMRIYPCQYFDNNFMVIRQNGDLVICAYNHEAANLKKLSPGNVFDDRELSLVEYYNNEKYTQLREDQSHGIFHSPCDTCGFAYTGFGFSGEIFFRHGIVKDKIYYHRDYYNQFFSLKKKWKDNSYYTNG
jgi:organic radical activating enzyme